MIQRFLDGFRRDKRKIEKPFINKFKKAVFYSFFGYTTFLVFSKKYKSQLIFTFQANQDNFKLIKNVKVLDNAVYQPTLFLFFGLLQKAYAKYFEQTPYIKLEQKQQLGDKQYCVPLHHNDQSRENVNLALVIGGSEGLDNLMKNIMLCTYRNGFKTIGILPLDIHNIQKLHKLVKSIKEQHQKRNPKTRIYGVGIEYGANLLTRYAAEHPQEIAGLVSIANPLDLQIAQKKVESSKIWKLFVYNQMLKNRVKQLKLAFPQMKIGKITSLYKLDQIAYNVDDIMLSKWKQEHSSINSIQKLKMKSLFIQSFQDPFSINLEGQERLQNSNCIYVETQGGGHHEWFQSNHFTRWICRPVSQFLKYLDNQFRD